MGDSLGQFGDPRRERSGSFLLDRLIEVGQAGVRVRPLGGNRAGEVRLGRFLRNPHVTPAEMVKTALALTRSTAKRSTRTMTSRQAGEKHDRTIEDSFPASASTGITGPPTKRPGRSRRCPKDSPAKPDDLMETDSDRSPD
jgi:hypothetical protein